MAERIVRAGKVLVVEGISGNQWKGLGCRTNSKCKNIQRKS